MGKLFGTDGVRGVANTELTPELVFKLGRAGAYLCSRPGERARLVIGKDTRQSGDMLEAALIAGICSSGADCISIGVAPTPAVAFLTRALGADAGVVISASHNPVSDNGIKFFSRDGYKLPDAVEDRLEELVLAKRDDLPRPIQGDVGKVLGAGNALDRYVDFVVSTVERDFRTLKIVIDCANGAAYDVAPRVLSRLGAEVAVINGAPDGININVGCGSTHPEGLQAAVKKYGADLGIAHDGDADRVVAVDERGEVVDGDQIMAICGLHRLKQGKLPQNTIVATVMSNLGLHLAFKRAGGMVLTTQVGDRYVLEAMREKDLALGGEQSGHIIFREFSTTGDGIITAVQLIAVMRATGRKLSELAAAMTRLPQLLVNVRVSDKHRWAEDPAIRAAIEAGEKQLGDQGRILVRPSGTEPLVRVMAEGPDQKQLEQIVGAIADCIKQRLG